MPRQTPLARSSPSSPITSLDAYLELLLGWKSQRTIELALRSIDLAKSGCTALVVLAGSDPFPLALGLHARIHVEGAPFVALDRKRLTAAEALPQACGGTLCLRAKRLPGDFSSIIPSLRDVNSRVLVMICSDSREARNLFLLRPAPIVVPSLESRKDEVQRIVTELCASAAAAIGPKIVERRRRRMKRWEVDGQIITPTDREIDWILETSPLTLAALGDAATKVIAMRNSTSVKEAADLLVVAPVTLTKWFELRRRRVAPPFTIG